MIERERSAVASGGLRNGFTEWVRWSSGFEEWVFWVSGFWVEFEQEKMKGMTRWCFGHYSTNELGLGWVEDEISFGRIRVK